MGVTRKYRRAAKAMARHQREPIPGLGAVLAESSKNIHHWLLGQLEGAAALLLAEGHALRKCQIQCAGPQTDWLDGGIGLRYELIDALGRPRFAAGWSAPRRSNGEGLVDLLVEEYTISTYFEVIPIPEEES